MRHGLAIFLLAAAAGCGGADDTSEAGGAAASATPWIEAERVLVSGHDVTSSDCRADVCRHNENTDLTTFGGAVYLVHRTAQSQVLGPNSSLRIYRSTDGGATFDPIAVLPAPDDRDLRDPHFYTVGSELYLKALTRLPVNSFRDSDVDTIAVGARSPDGVAWSPLEAIGPETWSFWRVREHEGTYYSAAYEDGDKSVRLFTSNDGAAWTMGPLVYGVAEDTPLETELVFMPSGKMLALVRTDGTDDELLGDTGRLRTQVCWASPPYDAFDCPGEIDGERLDGPLAFFHDGRLFVVARRHLQGTGKKRTALYELTGDLDAGVPEIHLWGDLPSAGDTAYAGAADVDASRVLVSWYSGDLEKDEGWAFGMFDLTDIRVATIDFSKLR